MSAAAFTAGPWESSETGIYAAYGWAVAYTPDQQDQRFTPEGVANARLIAAAPKLYDGCNAMLGLVQLLLGRDDLTDELRTVLTTNHRIGEAETALAKARGETL